MSDEKTRADSIRFYLTGATSQGGAQTDPNLSLGGYRSGSQVTLMGFSIANAISNISIDDVSAGNSVGEASLTASGVDTIQYTAPGGSIGAAVEILNGETKIIEDANDPSAFVRVTRTSADDLTGTATLTLVNAFNNVIGFDDVTDTELTAGHIDYRCICMKNVSDSVVKNLKVFIGLLGSQVDSDTAQLGASGAGTLAPTSTNFVGWPDSGFCRIEDQSGTLKEIVYYGARSTTELTVDADGRAQFGTSETTGASTDVLYPIPSIRIAEELPSSNQVQTIADEVTVPTGLTFVAPITAANAIDFGDLDPDEEIMLWLERNVVAGGSSSPSVRNLIEVTFSAA